MDGRHPGLVRHVGGALHSDSKEQTAMGETGSLRDLRPSRGTEDGMRRRIQILTECKSRQVNHTPKNCLQRTSNSLRQTKPAASLRNDLPQDITATLSLQAASPDFPVPPVIPGPTHSTLLTVPALEIMLTLLFRPS